MNVRHGGSFDALTWGQLLRSDALRDTQIVCDDGEERTARSVRLISHVDEVRSCRPGTVVVLQEPIADAAWAVEVAIRYAWERNACCVIGQLDPVAADSVIRLGERLGVPLGLHQGDLAQLALRLAPVVAEPDIVRSRLVAQCATRLASESSIEGGLRALNEQLPGVEVSLRHGHGPQAANDAVRHHVTKGGPTTIVLPLAALGLRTMRELVAVVEQPSPAWLDAVTTVLTIARAHVIAYEAAETLEFSALARTEEWLLDQLLRTVERGAGVPSETLARLGHPRGSGLCAAMLVPCDPEERADELMSVALRAAWPRRGGVAPMRYRDGWALWFGADPNDPDTGSRLARELDRTLTRLTPRFGLCAGIGDPVAEVGGLPHSLGRAHLAARAAQAGRASGTVVFDALGAKGMLVNARYVDLQPLLDESLAGLADAEDRDALLETLIAYFDCGASSSQAAARLGVHRNTVTSRLDRARRAGVPVDDPDHRLTLHLACYLSRSGG